MFDDALEAEVALGVRGGRRAVRVLFNCKARGTGVARHFLTDSEQVALCIWQRTLLSPGRRNAASEVDDGL